MKTGCGGWLPAGIWLAVVLAGCGMKADVGSSAMPLAAAANEENTGEYEEASPADAEGGRDGLWADVQEKEEDNAADGVDAAFPSEADVIYFVDSHGQEYRFEVNPAIERHSYDPEAFVRDGERLSYDGENVTSRQGLDISYYHGTIDWEKVRADGFEFAFIRLGFRGYGEEGRIRLDREFFQNIQNAQAAGLDVGVYFFSQAVNEEEAREEAEFVLQNLDGYELQLPVVYDPEHIEIEGEEARTDDVTGEQFTKNAEAFCRAIEEAGFQPMIYCNLMWQFLELDMEKLSQYPVWYADYGPLPQTPYQFDFWQYTNAAAVDGITGPVDLNIQLIRTQEEE